MTKKPTEQLDKIFEIDQHAKNGVFCAELTEEDKRAFADHARRRREAKNSK